MHTNFRLSSSGEYLGFIAPDGTVVQEFADYPPQVTDVSYGLGTDSVITNLADVGDAGSVIVPSDETLEGDWQLPDFDDGDWTGVTTPIGYETGGTELALYGEFVDGLSPVAHWTFDEEARFVAGDSSPNKINGLSLTSSREESPIGRAVNLTTTNDDVNMNGERIEFQQAQVG